MENSGMLGSVLRSRPAFWLGWPVFGWPVFGWLVFGWPVFAGCSADETPETSRSTPSATSSEALGTLDIKVRIDGACPVLRQGESCPDEPFAAKIAIEDLDGTPRLEVESGSDGSIQVELPAGQYRLVPVLPQPGAPPAADEQLIEVKPDTSVEATVLYDSGVR